ncbi:8479_t:CDS:2 [Acaulospora morrowiae]|uniref:8479_t:CDS:1 n=1 Tax=Acaulospora morrowiae TaxID=94023 RepID=A0A9N8VRG7_9GLOM|nr:8479_t:CDS:2 [Acaulospora morrowiae]
MLKGILAIGKTSHVKSFTRTIYSTKECIVSESATREVTVYECENGYLYIDTPGLNDAGTTRVDPQIGIDIVQKLHESNISQVQTILWFVSDEMESEQIYKNQALFIESLAQYHKGNVWDNVIIVIERKDHKKKTIQGPLKAVRAASRQKKDPLTRTGIFPICFFELMNGNARNLYENVDGYALNREYGIYKKSDPERIFVRYQEFMREHVQHPVTIVLRGVGCLNCPEDRDPRIANFKCHIKFEKTHSDKHNYIHPETCSKRVHHTGAGVSEYHLGELQYMHTSATKIHSGNIVIKKVKKDRTIYKFSLFGFSLLVVALFSPELLEVEQYDCCGANPDSEGCSYICCLKSLDEIGCEMIYDCCNSLNPCKERHDCCGKDKESEGCKFVYECCGKDENSKGCTEIYECCEKEVVENAGIAGCRETCIMCHKERNAEGCSFREHRYIRT